MRKLYILILSIAVSWGSLWSQQNFIASLSGLQEVPAVNTKAQGEVIAVLSGDQLIVSGSFRSLEGEFDPDIAGGAHIHLGYAGENGGVELSLVTNLSDDLKSGSFPEAENTFTLTQEQVEALQQRRLYVNIHSTTFASGELRGQILPEADSYHYFPLSGEAEVPPVSTQAAGAVIAELNGDELILSGSFSGLESAFDPNVAGGAHIHRARISENGGIAFNLSPELAQNMMAGTFLPASNTLNLSEEQKLALESGLYYVNIHSSMNQAGELRGQAQPIGNSRMFEAILSGDQQVPTASSDGKGVLKLELRNNILTVEGSFEGLTAAFDANIAGGAHLHFGWAGENGGIAVPLVAETDAGLLSGTFSRDANEFVLNAEQVNAMLERRIYVNIHTTAFPGGELRGQVVPAGSAVYLFDIKGENQAPAVMSTGSGKALVEIVDDYFVFSGAFSDLEGDFDASIAGGAHIHVGTPGSTGPIEFVVNSNVDTNLKSGVFTSNQNILPITNDQKESFALGQYYLNIHTSLHPMGEIRGNLMDVNGDIFVGTLSGRHEVPSIVSSAQGSITAQVVGQQLIVEGTFSGLSTEVNEEIAGGAHIHLGYAGENGGVELVLNPELDADKRSGSFLPDSNTFTLTEDQLRQLQARQWYVNIHTTGFPAGELRAQLLPQADNYYYFNLAGSNEVPSIMTTASGALIVEAYQDEVVVTGSFQGLEGEFDRNIAGGAHLHLGMAGENGPVDLIINARTSMDSKSGVFQADENQMAVTSDQLMNFEARRYYANIHTTKYPAGELRAQTTGMANAVFRAHLSGINQVPAIVTAADGQVLGEWFVDSLIVHGAFKELEGAVATEIVGGLHLHTGYAGQNGPVAIPLNVSLDTDSLGGVLNMSENQFNIDAMQATLLSSRQIYLNIHSRAYPSGELRGQMLAEAQMVFTSNLSSAQAVPNAASNGYGAIKGELNGSVLTLSGSYTGIESGVDTSIVGGLHLHQGLAGSTGGVEIVIQSFFPNPDLSSASILSSENTFEVSSEAIEMLRNRMLYANLHSQEFGAGEIRGQMLAESEYYMTAPLSGTAETPKPIETEANGMIILEVTEGNAVASGSFNGLNSPLDSDIAGGVHIHEGWAGQSGGVVFLLNSITDMKGTSANFLPSENMFNLSGGQIDTLKARGYYVNVHSEGVPTGEIRGNFLAPANNYWSATLAGINEVQPILSDATGAMYAELNGNQLTLSGSFNRLEGEFDETIGGGAHIHLAGPEANGGVDLLLNAFVFDDSLNGLFLPMDNTNTLDSGQLMNLFAESYYVNIHTTAQPAGELRGQLLNDINFFPMDAPSIDMPMDGQFVNLEGDDNQQAVISWDHTAMDENEVVYIWQAATDPDFDTIVVQQITGAETAIMFTFGALDTLLANLGVMPADTGLIYHRVAASDGSVQSFGSTSVAGFVRNLNVNSEQIFAEAGEMKVYPTSTSSNIQLELSATQTLNTSRLIIQDATGRTHYQNRVRVNSTYRDQIDVSQLSPGMYTISWMAQGELIEVKRFIKL